MAAYIFLRLNDLTLEAEQEDVERVFLSLASGTLSEEELSAWLRENAQP